MALPSIWSLWKRRKDERLVTPLPPSPDILYDYTVIDMSDVLTRQHDALMGITRLKIAANGYVPRVGELLADPSGEYRLVGQVEKVTPIIKGPADPDDWFTEPAVTGYELELTKPWHPRPEARFHWLEDELFPHWSGKAA